MNRVGNQSSTLGDIIDKIDPGISSIKANGMKYRVNKIISSRKDSVSIEATGWNGKGYISFNYYPGLENQKIRPCEMPLQEVERFLLGIQSTNDAKEARN